MDRTAPPTLPAHRARSRTCCCSSPALVFAMVVVGGITRLTESGLSITEWKPITGAIPPLSHADWQHAFDLYQATPAISRGRRPGGNDARRVQVHLLLGMGPPAARAGSSASSSLLPLLWFAVKRAIPKGYGWRLAALFVLGGAQGAIGWFMVDVGPRGPAPRSAPTACPRIC